jgi:stage V sporulation protein AD
MATRVSQSTIRLDKPPAILEHVSIVGKKEGDGPLGQEFDVVNEDTTFGEKTWEKAESRLQSNAVNMLLDKSRTATSDVDIIFAGDLLNQCIGSTYGLRQLDIPFLGLFGACSTMAESLISASLFVEGGLASKAVAVTSSHFCTAERQFRYPLEYGGVRTPTSQWTVTGSGAVLVGCDETKPKIRTVTVGKIVDLGITDANNMGAAMAPAACSTIKTYFHDTRERIENFDAIITGDLGKVGSRLLCELLERDGIDIRDKHLDCGCLIYDFDQQDVHAGGSGCGCCASVLCAHFLPKLERGELKRILFCATGALMSPTIVQQGESIPGICHLAELTAN